MINFISENKKFISNSLISSGSLIVNIIVMVFTTRYLIDTLSSQTYGIWLLLMNTISYVLLVNFGFNTNFIVNFNKFINENDLPQKQYLNTYFIFFLFLALIIVVVLVILSLFPSVIFNEEYSQTVSVLFLVITPGVLMTYLSGICEGIIFYNFKIIKARAIIETIRTSVQSILYCVFVYLFFKNLYSLAIVYSMIALFVFLYAIVFVTKKLNYKIEWKYFNKDLLLNDFGTSFKFWTLSISSIFISQFDFILISKFFKDLSIITLYAQSFRLSDIGVRFLKRITDNKVPEILDLFHKNNNIKLNQIVSKLLILNLILSSILCLVISILGKFILDLWLGDLMVFRNDLIVCFSLLSIPLSLQWVLWSYFNNTLQQNILVKMVFFEVFLNLTLSLILKDKFDILGLAMGSLIAISITTLLLFVKFLNIKKSIHF